MNPYQRIVRGNVLVQAGHINTQEKFAQLTEGLDLKGKRVLDVGCNLGEMCRLARDAGAITHGIDERPDYIEDAKRMNPGMPFSVRRAQNAVGRWDVAICSAMLHYITDLEPVIRRLARVADSVVGDVWLANGAGEMLVRTQRGLWIPTPGAWRAIAGKWWGGVEMRGPALSPDGSDRQLFTLSRPKREKPKAWVLYGASGTGKTTRARNLIAAGQADYHLQIDLIHVEMFKLGLVPWLSVSTVVGEAAHNAELRFRWMDYSRQYLTRWVGSKVNADVVIEGYDPLNDGYREMVVEILSERGWEVNVQCLKST